MELNENHNRLIIKYLTGQLSADEKIAFETELEANEELREEWRELSHIYMGLDIYDRVQADHIDSFLLATYAENSSELDDDIRQDIENHLESCPNCREELRLCRLTVEEGEAEPVPAPGESLWQRIKNLFFVPRMSLRPAWVAVVFLLFAIPVIYTINKYQSAGDKVQIFTIEAVTRDSARQNIISLPSNLSVVSLKFTPPVLADGSYVFELYNANNELQLSSGAQKMKSDKNYFTFEIPVSYFLNEGLYILKIVEITGTGTDYLESYYFQVKLRE